MLFLAKHPEYEHYPVTMREFLNDPMFTPPADNQRPHSEMVLSEIFDTGDESDFHRMGEYEEVLYIAGIGSGKSFMSSKAMHYMLYRLLCFKDPQKYFNLGVNAPLAFINISKSFTQAKDVVFNEMKNRIDSSPWFQKYYPPNPKIRSRLVFEQKNITILPAGSNEEAPIGYNIFGAVIDEAAFHTITKDRDYARDSYNQIKKRIRSRFLNHGKLFIITSPRFTYDFAETKYREDDNPKLYKRRTALWEAIPARQFVGEKFDVAKYLPQYDGKNIMVPIEYEQEFRQNPERAMRDYGAVASMSIQGFFRDPDIIPAYFDKTRDHPIDPKTGDFADWFHNRKGTENYDPDPRFIHVDLALNRDGNGDAAGFAMGKFAGWKIEKLPDGSVEKRPKIKIDYMEQIRAKNNGEILFSDVRQKIYDIRDMGYNIAKVSFDGWNSVDSIQTLKDKGFKAETLSVDKSLEPYYTFKEAMLDDRLDIYYYKPIIKEVQQLEEVNGRKVDHPRNGSKDVADAVAGVCYHAAQKTSGSGVLGS